MGHVLPAGFSELEPFVDQWVLADTAARSAKRRSCSYAELRQFYDAMVGHAERALELLSAQQLGCLGAPEQRLLKLMLSLAEIGPAIEWYESPEVLDGFPADCFPMVEMLPDTRAQE